MPGHDIIVIGASAGGVEALRQLVPTLSKDIPAAIFVVMHVPAQGVSMLPQVIAHKTSLPVSHPADGEPIKQGHIYVAPPDHHLIVDNGVVRLSRGPKENRHRPAVDTLFRSAALRYGPRVVGVVLTGALDDGTSGLVAIKRRGGKAIVQDPTEAIYPSMPQSALNNVDVDYCLPVADMGEQLEQLARQPADDEAKYPASQGMEFETRAVEVEAIAMDGADAVRNLNALGEPSIFTCPECHGTLWEINESHDILRFRCRVGHSYTAESMAADHTSSLEAALWAALRALEESASLARRMAARGRERSHMALSARYEDRAIEAEHHATLLRTILHKDGHELADEISMAHDGV